MRTRDNVRRRHRGAGFTLIELLVTLAVMVIMATVAVPSYQEFSARNEVAAEVMRIKTALALARNTAITRRTTITVCPTTDQQACATDWQQPLMLFENLGTGGQRDTATEPIMKRWPESPASVAYKGFGSDRYIRYTPAGSPQAQNGTFTICMNQQPASLLVLSAVGRLRYSQGENCE